MTMSLEKMTEKIYDFLSNTVQMHKVNWTEKGKKGIEYFYAGYKVRKDTDGINVRKITGDRYKPVVTAKDLRMAYMKIINFSPDRISLS